MEADFVGFLWGGFMQGQMHFTEGNVRHRWMTCAWCVSCLSVALHLQTSCAQCCRNLSCQNVWALALGGHSPPWVSASLLVPNDPVISYCPALGCDTVVCVSEHPVSSMPLSTDSCSRPISSSQGAWEPFRCLLGSHHEWPPPPQIPQSPGRELDVSGPETPGPLHGLFWYVSGQPPPVYSLRAVNKHGSFREE